MTLSEFISSRIFKVAIFLVFCLSIGNAVFASVVYVTQNGSGVKSGANWANAISDNELFNAFRTAGSGTQFWLAKGTYHSYVGGSGTYTLGSGVSVYGGFLGNEAALGQQNPTLNITTLMGSSGQLMVVLNPTAPVILDGVTLTQGNATLQTSFGVLGGGLWISGGANLVTVNNVIFQGNKANAGGAMYINNSSPNITNCTFNNNIATASYTYGTDGEGGAIYIEATQHSSSANGANGTCQPTISNCKFTGNTGGYGGAIATSSEDVYTCSPVITNCIFTGNGNYAIEMLGDNLSAAIRCNSTIQNCVFLQNTGSAIYSNSMLNNGFGQMTTVIQNCVFTGSNEYAVFNEATADVPADIDPHFVYVSVVNSTFFNQPAINNYNANATCINSIVQTNSSPFLNGGSAWVQTAVSYSLVKGGYAGTGNISADPVFVNAGNLIGPDQVWGTADDGLMLLPCNSPAINAGLGSGGTDIRGVARIGNVDMGAYEQTNTTITPTITINSSLNTICAKTPVTFTASSTYGGTSPAYQWTKNGSKTGTNSATYIDSTLNNNDVISCVLTSNIACSTGPVNSNNITMLVNPQLNPTVSVAASASSICSGNSVTFTATAVNGGASPIYQWLRKNKIEGGNTNTYTDSFTTADTVKCIITSNAVCALPTKATSAGIIINIKPKIVPVVTIQSSATIVYPKMKVVFTAAVTNGGTNPLFNWQKDGQTVGQDLSTYTDSLLVGNEQILCIVTNNFECPQSDTSNVIKVQMVAPQISSFSPQSASAGKTVVIKGKYFTGTAFVQFGGDFAASFKVDSDSQISAVVGDGQTGSITVTTPGGQVSSPGFTELVGQSISFSNLASALYTAADYDPGATASSGLAVVYTSSNPSVATIVNNKVHITGVGTTTITASQPGNTFYDSAPPVNQTLTIGQGRQTITLAATAAKVYGDADFTPGAVSSSGLPVTYTSSDTTVAAIKNNLVHILKAGSTNIVAVQQGSVDYTAAKSVTQKLTVSRAAQIITFATLPSAMYGGVAIVPSATASSGLAVAYTSSDTTIIKVSGANLLIRGVGTATITANQAGNVDYQAAAPVSQALTVGKGNQTITFAALATKIYGAVDFPLTATAGSKLAVSYTSSDTTVAKVSAAEVHIVSAGTVIITANQSGSTQYNPAAPVSQTLVINPAAQTITFAAIPAKTYGAANFALTATTTSKLAVSYSSSNTAVATIVNGNLHIVGAGTSVITASQAGNIDYTGATAVTETLTVNKAPLTIKVNSQTITYGSAIPALTVTYTGFVNGETSAILTTQPTITTTALTTSPVGGYPITASGAAAANYTITYTAGTLTISKAAQTITFATLPSAMYGGAAIVPSATASSGLAVAYTSSDTTIIKVSGANLLIRGVGTATITANQAGNVDYQAASPVSQALTVGKGNQTITFAALAAKTYGAVDFPLTATAGSKLAVSYTSSDTTVAKVSGAEVHIVSAGTVIITANQSGSTQYNPAAPVSQTLVINPAAQTITFAAIPAKTYGAANFALTAATTSKLAVSYSSSNTSVATIVNGNLHIVGAGTSVITASQAGNIDYTGATAVTETLTVNKAPLTIKVNSQTITYGSAIPALTVTYTGFVNGETSAILTTQPTITTTALTTSPVGGYPITASGAAAANYTITYTAGTLTISKASQTITFATLPSAMYGGAAIVPSATASSGLAVAYTSSDTTIIKVSGANLLIRGVGTATITASQAGNVDYQVAAPVSQALTVGKGNQTITFAALAAKTYGAVDFPLTATAGSKLAVSYTSSDTTVAKVSGAEVHIVSAGTVIITANQSGSTQYNPAAPVSQTLVINPAAQTITFAAIPAKTYGAANFALTAATTSKLAVSYSSSNTSVATIVNGNLHIVGAGTSVITASQAGNIDYTGATAVTETLTVNKAPLTIKVNSQTITYGSAIPALTVTYTGFVNGETSAILTTQPTITTTALTTSPVGGYPITASGAAAANYTITYTAGTLTISKASQTITFATLPSAMYGGAAIVPSATASSGLAVAYTSSDTTIIKVSGANLLIRGVGTATITASQAGNVDYQVAAPVSQALTVGKGNQTITFAALAAKTYGAVDFPLTATAGSKLAVSYTSSDTTVAKVSAAEVHIVSAGTVIITANQSGSTQYNPAAPVSQTLVINPAAQTITFAAIPAKTYGAANFALTATTTSKLAVSYSSSNTAVATIVNGNLHIVGAGTSVITASQAGNIDYTGATAVTETLTVNKAPLTIKVNSQTITYGSAIPALTVTYTGFVNGETSTILTTQPTITTTALTTSPVGGYPITASGAAAANYTITYTAGTLTISKAAQTITFATLPSAMYGGAAIVPSATASSGLAVAYTSSDTTIIKVSGANLLIRGVGTATITANQAGNVDYQAASPVSQALTVGKGNQTITFAALATKIYGAVDFPLTATAGSKLAVSYTSSDLSVATIVSGSLHFVGAGTAAITASQPGNADYKAATAVTETLTVNKTTLNIKANGQTITFGSAIPAFTLTYTGFVNSETNTILAIQPTVTTTATALSPIGTYPIAASGAAAPNYTITYTAGTLTIKAATGADGFYGDSTAISVNSDHLYINVLHEPVVNQAVSPNGDGINDVLLIDNIGSFPDNHLVLMNRDGRIIFKADHYDNVSRAFDGHSSVTGQNLLPGTYFYLLEYRVKGVLKRKTGFFVLKY